MDSFAFKRGVVMALVLMLTFFASAEGAGVRKYGIVVDAGSTGTRLKIYTWITTTSHIIPEMTQVEPSKADEPSTKKEPGVSSFADNPSGVGPYFASLLTMAKKYVPESEHSSTPIYVYATAGMRLLKGQQASAVWNSLRTYLGDKSKSPFLFTPRQAKTLSGEEEAAFGFLSTNYILGFGNLTKTLGSLDLGGASTEIAMATDQEILENYFPLVVNEKPLNFYATSYLDYGQDVALIQAHEQWLSAKQTVIERDAINISSPCFQDGYMINITLNSITRIVKGTGNYTECKAIVLKYLHLDYLCTAKPCGWAGRYMPPVSTAPNGFFAISGFFYTLNGLDLVGWNDKWSGKLADVKPRAELMCSTASVNASTVWPKAEPKYLPTYCFQAIYMETILIDGYKFDPSKTGVIQSALKLNGFSTGWTAGAMIYVGRDFFNVGEGGSPIPCTHAASAASPATGVQWLVTILSSAMVVLVICLSK